MNWSFSKIYSSFKVILFVALKNLFILSIKSFFLADKYLGAS
jgi:hypothetical protein